MGGSDRRAAIESMLQPVGGTVERIAFVRGEYDILVSATIPDSNALIGITTAVRASGAFEKVIVLEEVDIQSILTIANKVAVAYTPAG